MTSDTPWLSDREERVWRGWLRLNAELSATLQRDLQDDAGLSMQDYEVLVNLTDSPDGRIRVTDLARMLFWERSRVSHHVTRMQRRGLVERVECPEDGRGAFIAVTPTGRAAIERAAPGHVRGVRRLVFDGLTDDEIDDLGAVVDTLLARIDLADGRTAGMADEFPRRPGSPPP